MQKNFSTHCKSFFNQINISFVSDTAEIDWKLTKSKFFNATKNVQGYYGVFTKSMIEIYFD